MESIWRSSDGVLNSINNSFFQKLLGRDTENRWLLRFREWGWYNIMSVSKRTCVCLSLQKTCQPQKDCIRYGVKWQVQTNSGNTEKLLLLAQRSEVIEPVPCVCVCVCVCVSVCNLANFAHAHAGNAERTLGRRNFTTRIVGGASTLRHFHFLMELWQSCWRRFDLLFICKTLHDVLNLRAFL